MSLDEEIDKGDKPAFKWGKKRCMGGAKRSIPIYESFTYDEVEYFLYDCVYLYKDGEVEPYIGKLIKIWELPNGEKKIKVLWFFRPVEIRNYLRDNVALEKELFLASGEGVGLVNVNPLEAIAGKCNVVCISKDKRNTEPSEEEIKRADFIFFRTFDVGKLSISDDIVGTIAGQDVNFIFNKKRPETSDILKSEATAKDNNAKVVASNAAQLLSKLDLQGTNKDVVKDDKVVRASSSVAKDVDSRASLLNSGKRALDERRSDDNNIQRKKIKVDDDKNSKASLAQSDVRAKLKPGDKNSKDSLAQSDDRAKLKPVDKNGKDFLAQSDDKAKLKPGDDLAKPDSRLFKKVKVNDNSSKSEVQYSISRPIVSDNDKASEALINSSEDKLNAIAVFSSIRWDTETSKRVKLDEKTKLADESLQKLSAAAPDREIKTNGQVVEVSRMPDVVTNNQKASEVPISCIEGKLKPITASSSIGRDMGTSKKMKLDAKKTKLVDESLPKTSEAAPEKDIKTQAVEFNRRPDAVNNNDKDSEVPISSTEGKLKPSTVNSLSGQDMGTSKKVKLDERKTKLAYESSQKTSEAAPDKDIKSQTIEVTRRPEADRSKWFKGVPWEERMDDAHKQGTLVLLENLDPSYTSSEIQDIIWHAFGVTCTAKVVQHTMISSPHSGRALAIFKHKDAAETVVRRLEEGCLMLPNGRPLVGSRRIPVVQGKQSQFFGHLVIDKVKFQTQREELKKAVSTSHCSQPNTIEYEMAMDWKLLQSKSDIWWKDLYKQQGEELRKLESGLKNK